MKFFRHNWFYVAIALFILLAMVIGIFYQQIGQLRVLLILNFMAMLAHQFEEYGIPGGFGAVSNRFIANETEMPDRFPFNPQQTMVTNVAAWVFYTLTIIFDHTSWLALTTIFAIALQINQHFILTPKHLKRFYNPGVATTLLTLIPAGIAYWIYADSQGLISGTDIVIGILGAVVFVVVCVKLPIRFMHSRNTPYAYTDDEMNKPYIQWLAKQLNK